MRGFVNPSFFSYFESRISSFAPRARDSREANSSVGFVRPDSKRAIADCVVPARSASCLSSSSTAAAQASSTPSERLICRASSLCMPRKTAADYNAVARQPPAVCGGCLQAAFRLRQDRSRASSGCVACTRRKG